MTKRVEIIDKKKFAATVLNADDYTFVVYIAALAKSTTISIHPSCQAQIALLMIEKTGILAKYSEFSNVFFSDSAAELLEHIRINDNPINLLDNKQPPYGPIYSPEPVELEMLKTYIKANLASSFIGPSKSPTSVLILFIWKKDGDFRLCIDYQRLNNLTIKNCYPLLLIGKLLNCLGCTKRFTQLNLINAYHWMRIWKGNKWKIAF